NQPVARVARIRRPATLVDVGDRAERIGMCPVPFVEAHQASLPARPGRALRSGVGGGARGQQRRGDVELADDWGELLRTEAPNYARVALTNIRRELPAGGYPSMTAPGDLPFRPKARTPAFYGSYDWHSCVEMHWLLLRLLRIAQDVIPAKEIRSTMNAHFRPVALAAETEFITSRSGLGERPYGWGWALA